MEYFLRPSALRDLKKLSNDAQKRIIRKLDFYTASPNVLKFAEPLIGTRFGEWRFRIGDYRVIFDIAQNVIIILSVGHRKDIYK
jgi:mRNA interferase RelE/StbE